MIRSVDGDTARDQRGAVPSPGQSPRWHPAAKVDKTVTARVRRRRSHSGCTYGYFANDGSSSSQ